MKGCGAIVLLLRKGLTVLKLTVLKLAVLLLQL